MELNADFSKRVVVHSDEVAWAASPMPGVDRRMLDRIGDEVARATTIVRYAPNSQFSPHTHTGGEEFIVLEGVFQDQYGDFPAGSYVRNPPTSSHKPGSDEGCTIFVKLWQFDPEDRHQMSVVMDDAPNTADEIREGVSVTPLYQDERETVVMEEWDANASVEMDLPKGGELLVLDGTFSENGDDLRKHSWLRIPEGGKLSAIAGKSGAKVWIKTGHIPFASAPAV